MTIQVESREPVEPLPEKTTTTASGPACNRVAATEAASRAAWRSDELLGDRTEVLILHNNEVYRLRRTRQGKLILHK